MFLYLIKSIMFMNYALLYATIYIVATCDLLCKNVYLMYSAVQ